VNARQRRVHRRARERARLTCCVTCHDLGVTECMWQIPDGKLTLKLPDGSEVQMVWADWKVP